MSKSIFISLLFINLSLFGQIIKLESALPKVDPGQSIIVELFNDTIAEEVLSVFHMKYRLNELDWLNEVWFPDGLLTDSNQVDFFEAKDLNGSSLLRIQIDSIGGCVDIMGLEKIMTDTLIISDIAIIPNEFPIESFFNIVYFKYPKKRDSLHPKPDLFKKVTIKDGYVKDSSLNYSITINDNKYNFILRPDEITERSHYSGYNCFWWYSIRHKLYGHSPKRYISWNGSEYVKYKFWTGILVL